MATIKPIEGRTIHQIQSGQVIVDLCSVVKELVENSLDAGATSVEVRFKNQGLDSVEVQDNGNGITPQNYETVALKHHTSKLSTYSDLTTLQTFGFRGEALSSLCALSRFTIVTCLTSDAPRGTKLDFDISGKLNGTSIVAAQRGTTVTVEHIFHNLPVRRRELERNIKKEWNHVIGLLGQYACIQTGVKISVTQQTPKGKKTTLFSTKGNPSTRENIINVFGAKTWSALLTLDLKLDIEPTSRPNQRWSAENEECSHQIHIVGHISRPVFGEGRQTPDRQMFFVNARPCHLPQVAKAFNEVYKSYNSSQSAFIFANIEMDTHLYDVNVSPDKRTILLHEQTQMLERLKTSLTELFESQDYTVPISQLAAQKQVSYRQLTITREKRDSKDTHAPAESAASPKNSDEPDNESKSEITDQDADERKPRKMWKPSAHQRAVSQESMSRDRGAVGLINNWLGKKTVKRTVQSELNLDIPSGKTSGISREKFKLAKKLENGSKHADSDVDDSESSGSSASLPPVSHDILTTMPDSTAQLAGPDLETSTIQSKALPAGPEDPIPAFASPARRSVLTVGNFAPSVVRSTRAPTTIATITIGDHTVVSPIGTPAKRTRIEKVAESNNSSSTIPSFGNRLTQRFTAGRNAQDSDTSDFGMIQDAPEAKIPSEMQEESTSAMEELSGSQQENGKEAAHSKILIEDSLLLQPADDSDGDYIDEDEKKAQEEAKVIEMIKIAENEAARPSGENAKRANNLLNGGTRRKGATLQLVQNIDTTVEKVSSRLCQLIQALSAYKKAEKRGDITEQPSDSNAAEEKLSLAINKADFANMKIIGQFNLGFILATRTGARCDENSDSPPATDDLFIIDQHASDEKYNFERLQTTTIVQSQRLVQPKTLELTAIEEEIVMENLEALETNGFVVTADNSGESPVGQRCQLISLPLSRETVFSILDLEELISLLADHPSASNTDPRAGAPAVPRPSRVRKMFAMRACRSSIMIGRTLTVKQMEKVVKHMGEIDKPWNCPHGRPTMRHLFNLGGRDDVGWREGMGVEGDGDEDKGQVTTDWASWVRMKRDAA